MRNSAARPASMQDVARMAGVSHQTVSRVINGHHSIRPETKARVLAAMSELHYRPNRAARALASDRSRSIGLIASSTAEFGPATTISTVERQLRKAGYSVLIATVDAGDPNGAAAALDYLANHRVDGIVLTTGEAAVFQGVAAVAPTAPIVSTKMFAQGNFPTVAVDQVAGAKTAVAHLLEQGHQHIYHIAGPADWLDAVGRVQGYQLGMRAVGLEPLPIHYGDWSAASGYRLAQLIFQQHPVDAIFAANDQIALGVLHAARTQGLRVPQDLSLVGFDDTPEAAFYGPPLTTVRQDFQRLGEAAVSILLQQIDPAEDATASLPSGSTENRAASAGLIVPHLIERESTTPK